MIDGEKNLPVEVAVTLGGFCEDAADGQALAQEFIQWLTEALVGDPMYDRLKILATNAFVGDPERGG